MDKFEEQIHNDLHQYLLSVNEIDERLPECADVEGKWETIANAYIPDGMTIGSTMLRKTTCMTICVTNAATMPWTSISAETYSNSKTRILLRLKSSLASVPHECITR